MAADDFDEAWGERADDAIFAVAAHALLNTLSIVIGSVDTVRHHWDDLEPARRDRLLATAAEQAEHVAGVLEDLARGLPPGSRHRLDALHDLFGDPRH